MHLLIIRERGAADRAYDLLGEDVLIGRSKQCDLRLANVSVSREHIRLVWSAAGYAVEDLGSHNGVYVNGDRVKAHQLASGDELRLGKFVLIYVHGDLPRKLRHKDSESVLQWHGAQTETVDDETFRLSVSQLDDLMAARALVEGARWVPDGSADGGWLLGESDWTLGKGAPIPVEGRWTAAKIAVIQWNGRHHVIERVKGWGKLFVNGQEMAGRVLEPGDVVDLGKSRFRYVIST